MIRTKRIETLSVEECMEKWNLFKSSRWRKLDEGEEWNLTVRDRESILDMVVERLEGYLE